MTEIEYVWKNPTRLIFTCKAYIMLRAVSFVKLHEYVNTLESKQQQKK